MDFWASIGGTLTVCFMSAVPEEMLTYLNNAGIALSDIAFPKPMTAQFHIRRSQYKIARRLLEKKGIQLDIIRKVGLYWYFMRLTERPVLILGSILFLFLSLYLPGRIFFVQVVGNDSIPQQLILEQAESCGICFGASRREVRSEKMKNALLYRIPQLQWAGINTSGCVATITVKEREMQPKPSEVKPAGNLIAIRDAIIQECTVYQGTQLCRVGQAVRAGEVLVSGYTDCGIAVKFSRANAEIYGQTMRQYDVVTLTCTATRGEIARKETYYTLQIGKNLINFFSDSGISSSSCVKMYSKQYVTLPGGFLLPVALITQTRIFYETVKENKLKKEKAVNG